MAGEFLAAAARRFAEDGVEVQTTDWRSRRSPRSAGPTTRPGSSRSHATSKRPARSMASITSIGPIRWGRVGPEAGRRHAAARSPTLVATDQINGSIETTNGGSSGRRGAGGRHPRRAAGPETPLGFGNFRFCTIAECGPNIPFFPQRRTTTTARPASRSGSRRPTTCARRSPGPGRSTTSNGGSARRSARRWSGLSRSPARSKRRRDRLRRDRPDAAPFTADEDSAAGMLEDFGVGELGASGTLAAAGALTRMLKRLRLAQVGYSGSMLRSWRTRSWRHGRRPGWPRSPSCCFTRRSAGLPGHRAAAQRRFRALAAIVLDVSAMAVASGEAAELLPVPQCRASGRGAYRVRSPISGERPVLPLKGRVDPRLFERFARKGSSRREGGSSMRNTLFLALGILLVLGSSSRGTASSGRSDRSGAVRHRAGVPLPGVRPGRP